MDTQTPIFDQLVAEHGISFEAPEAEHDDAPQPSEADDEGASFWDGVGVDD